LNYDCSDRLDLPPFPAEILGTSPKFTKQMDKQLLDFVSMQEGLFMDPEFINWKWFSFKKVEYAQSNTLLIFLPIFGSIIQYFI
jgi:hypothetical protein